MRQPLAMTTTEAGFPCYVPEVFRTSRGTPYLKEAGLALVAMPAVDLEGIRPFLDGFDPALGFADYLDDPDTLTPAEQLVKFFGQGCYLSFGPARTRNKDIAAYVGNLKLSGHGSVLEHANFSLWIWGIDRSVTHELVRHRAGWGFSQVSQRFVDGTKLRFVERPEYQPDRLPDTADDLLVSSAWDLHEEFERDIDRARAAYDQRAATLVNLRTLGHPLLQGGSKTDARKQVNQSARAILPNETEAPIGVTGNVRAFRHFCEMRANAAADVQIRELAVKVYRCLKAVAPVLFDDYEIEVLPSGTEAIRTATRKV